MIAQEVTPRVQQWLRNSRSARVLHVFDHSCTLANERDEVISLVAPAVGLGPFTALLADDFPTGLDVHQPVTLDAVRPALTVGPLVVDARGAAVWQPRPDWSRLEGVALGQWPPAAALPADIDRALKLTLQGILAHDAPACLAGVEGLVGRGRGLTPTGDDVLVGILYGLWVWYPRHRRPLREQWIGMIRDAAVSRTTILSANFIRAAGDGEAVWQWHDLVHGRPHAVDRLLAIGHTSGADAWAGFTSTASVLSPALGQRAR